MIKISTVLSPDLCLTLQDELALTLKLLQEKVDSLIEIQRTSKDMSKYIKV